MHRRTLLGTAASVSALALAGCQELGFTTPVMVTIENETDVDRSVVVTAYDTEGGQQTYDEAVNAPSAHTASLAHLSNTDQLVRVVLFETDDADDSGTDDDPGESGGDEDGGAEGGGEETAGESPGGDDLDESDEAVEAVEETFIGERTQSIVVYIRDDGIELDVASRDP